MFLKLYVLNSTSNPGYFSVHDDCAMASTSQATTAGSKRKAESTSFAVGPAAKRELRRALRQTTDPAATISSFQQQHSWHSMMARALGTKARYEVEGSNKDNLVESLDTDSVLLFLSHLGTTHHEVHKRLSDTLLRQLDDEIRKTRSEQPLLDLLKSCWQYVTTVSELRPILWSVLKQLGDRTPAAVLKALSEREEEQNKSKDGVGQSPNLDQKNHKMNQLKHAEIFNSLPATLKRLCWQDDWISRVPLETSLPPSGYLDLCQTTLLYDALLPHIESFCKNDRLVQQANLQFVATLRERKVPTLQRRALTAIGTSGATSTNSGGSSAAAPLTSWMRGKSSAAPVAVTTSTSDSGIWTSGQSIAQLRNLLSDSTNSGTTASSFRPPLLYALLSVLMARHGKLVEGQQNSSSTNVLFLGGAQHLTCTLVADILLSAGGSLPKPYQHVQELARLLDDCVQQGTIDNPKLQSLQTLLRHIFQGPDDEDILEKAAVVEEKEDLGAKKSTASSATKRRKENDEISLSNSSKRHLNRLITVGLNAMKEIDPQNLFLHPVTDAIAPGYSKVIKKPMCIATMEQKVKRSAYATISAWEADVKLMFQNCCAYNRGAAGQWFRGEAKRQEQEFQTQIYRQAKAQYDADIVKRAPLVPDSRRPAGSTEVQQSLTLNPLKESARKRRKDSREEYIPSMPALASMLLADPFVVRVFLSRILRELKRGVLDGSSLPAAHGVIPSLLQVLHLARWSCHLCALRGQRYRVPPSGMDKSAESSGNDYSLVPYESLRRFLPLLLRLLLEAELDRRTEMGGDLYDASQAIDQIAPVVPVACWEGHQEHSEVVASLIEGALIDLCQPGAGRDSSLAVSFPKLASALASVSSQATRNHRAFFLSLIQAILKHKTKLPKETRDSIVNSWLGWLEDKQDEQESSCLLTVSHECFIMLLNEWSSLGNMLLPRNDLLVFSTKCVSTVNRSMFAEAWQQTTPELSTEENENVEREFTPIRNQYKRMLNFLPKEQSDEWVKDIIDNGA